MLTDREARMLCVDDCMQVDPHTDVSRSKTHILTKWLSPPSAPFSITYTHTVYTLTYSILYTTDILRVVLEEMLISVQFRRYYIYHQLILSNIISTISQVIIFYAPICCCNVKVFLLKKILTKRCSLMNFHSRH